jgi:hypothetical protein
MQLNFEAARPAAIATKPRAYVIWGSKRFHAA